MGQKQCATNIPAILKADDIFESSSAALADADLLWVVHDVREATSDSILDNRIHIFYRELCCIILEIHGLLPRTVAVLVFSTLWSGEAAHQIRWLQIPGD